MSQTCPYCRESILETDLSECPTCRTPHHHDCWQENGGCTVFGCGSAPADDPKIAISSQEIRTSAIAPVSSAAYFILRHGQQMGPYTLDALREETYRNGISPTDLGWTAGMPEWLPLAQVLSRRTGPPPLPQTAAVAYPARSFSPQTERDPCAGRPRFGRGLFFLSLVGICFMLTALSSVKETKDIGLLFFWCALIPVCVFRIRDVGMSGWTVLLTIVPLGNLYLWFHLLLAPRGYAITKEADGFLRAMIWVVLALVALFVICLIVGLATNH